MTSRRDFRNMFIGIFVLLCAQPLYAASTQEIDIEVEGALEKFHKEVEGSEKFLAKAKIVVRLI